VDTIRAEALAHFRARRFQEAAAAYERASRLAPTNVGIWNGLGAARMAAGDRSGAVQAYQQSVRLAPTSAGPHAALGRAMAENGDRAGARREYQRALDLDPNNRDAQIGMSRL
jgi:Flp pilus assembly protein TadD